MPVWLAALLFIIFAGAFSVLLDLAFKKSKRGLLIAGACIAGALLLSLAGYILLTVLFVGSI
jgi:hypothetical protein